MSSGREVVVLWPCQDENVTTDGETSPVFGFLYNEAQLSLTNPLDVSASVALFI